MVEREILPSGRWIAARHRPNRMASVPHASKHDVCATAPNSAESLPRLTAGHLLGLGIPRRTSHRVILLAS
jgi:hypothetical protein